MQRSKVSLTPLSAPLPPPPFQCWVRWDARERVVGGGGLQVGLFYSLGYPCASLCRAVTGQSLCVCRICFSWPTSDLSEVTSFWKNKQTNQTHADTLRNVPWVWCYDKWREDIMAISGDAAGFFSPPVATQSTAGKNPKGPKSLFFKKKACETADRQGDL